MLVNQIFVQFKKKKKIVFYTLTDLWLPISNYTFILIMFF